MKEREKQVKLEKKVFSNRASMDEQNVIEEEMYEQSPSPKHETKATPLVIDEESSPYVGELSIPIKNGKLGSQM